MITLKELNYLLRISISELNHSSFHVDNTDLVATTSGHQVGLSRWLERCIPHL